MAKTIELKVYFKKSLELQQIEEMFPKLTLFTTEKPYKVTYNNNLLLKNDISSAFTDISDFCVDSDFTIELGEGVNTIKFFRSKYNFFLIQTSFSGSTFEYICETVAKAQGIVLSGINVCCPICAGQGYVKKMLITALDERVLICDECEATWKIGSPILQSTYTVIDDFLEERGLRYDTERKYQGYYTENDVIEEIENASK